MLLTDIEIKPQNNKRRANKEKERTRASTTVHIPQENAKSASRQADAQRHE